MPAFPGPFKPTKLADPVRLAGVLRDAGYTAEMLAKVGVLSRGRESLPHWELKRRSEGGGPLEALIRVFALGLAEPVASLEGVFGRPLLASLIDSGILIASGDTLRAEAALIPTADILFFRDFAPESGPGAAPPRDDLVLPVGKATLLVAQLTVRRRARLALDLGTGQGFQAVACASHCDRVIATDITERSLSFAAMNAHLNGVPLASTPTDRGLEVRLGGYFEPVADCRGRFDLIACNPPYVITPPQSVVGFSGGGGGGGGGGNAKGKQEGDSIVSRIVREIPTYLADGGFATLVMNWQHTTRDDWPLRPQSWLGSSPVDAWLIRSSTMTARDYAMQWVERFAGSPDRVEPAEVDRWTRHYESLGITAISFGAIIIRKRSPTPTGSSWFRASDLELDLKQGFAGRQIEDVFAGSTLLAGLKSGDDLLAMKLQPAAALIIRDSRTLDGNAWHRTGATLTRAEGLPLDHPSDPATERLLQLCDTHRDVGSVLATLAAESRVPVDTVLREGLAAVAELLRDGLLIPANPEGT